MNGQWWMVALVILSLSACGGDNDSQLTSTDNEEPPVQQEENTTVPLQSNVADDPLLSSVPEPILDELILPAISDLEGTLIFTRGMNLYRGQFDGEITQMLVSGTSAATVSIIPNQLAVTHISSGVRRLSMMNTNLITGESIPIMRVSRLRDLGGHVGGWSPDQQWGLILDAPSSHWKIVKMDGSVEHDLGSDANAVWLDNNTVFVIQLNSTFVRQGFAGFDEEQTQIVGFAIFDPLTGETTALDLPSDAIRNHYDINGIELVVRDFGQHVASEGDLNYSLTDGNNRLMIVLPEANIKAQVETCNTWALEQLNNLGERTIIYEKQDVLSLSNLTLLSDDSVLFLEWVLEGCEIMGKMSAYLMRLFPDGQAVKVAEGIAPIEEGRNNLLVFQYTKGHRYAVSPDEQYVVWAGGSSDIGNSSLNLTGLDTGATVPILTAGLGNSFDDFIGNYAFSTVYWLANSVGE